MNGFDRADQAFACGDLATAMREVEGRLVTDPKNAEALVRLCIYRRQSGDGPKSLEAGLRALSLLPRDMTVHNELGLTYLFMKQPQRAISHFRLAIEASPEQPSLHRNLGTALQEFGDDIEAAKEFRAAIRLAPDTANSYGSLGNLLLVHGNSPGAVKCFRKAHELEPNSTWGKLQLARAETEDGNFESSEVVLRQIIGADPNHLVAHGMLGHVLQQRGRFYEAEEFLNKAIKIEPTFVPPYFNLTFGKKISIEEEELLIRMEGLSRSLLSPEDRKLLFYSLGKGNDDLARYEKANEYFDKANAIALQGLQQAGRGFDAPTYHSRIDSVIKQSEQAPQAHKNDSELPIFIVGMMRSGTTLVEQILSSHPEIGAGGEIRYWLDAEEPNAFDYLEILRSLEPNKARVTDKMPQNYFQLGLIHAQLPSARIIHCKRHPIDNCLSIYVTPYRTSPDFAHNRSNIVFAYREYQRLMEHWRACLPSSQFMEVQYEDLICDRTNQTRRLIEFTGLQWSESCLEPEVNGRSVRTPSLWQARQPVYRSSISRWKNYEPWLGEFASLGDGE